MVQRTARSIASGAKMRFSQRLWEAKFKIAASREAAARNRVPHRTRAVSLPVVQKRARPSTISAAAVQMTAAALLSR